MQFTSAGVPSRFQRTRSPIRVARTAISVWRIDARDCLIAATSGGIHAFLPDGSGAPTERAKRL